MSTLQINQDQASFVLEFPDGRTITGKCEAATIERMFTGMPDFSVDNMGFGLGGFYSPDDLALEITLSGVRDAAMAWQEDIEREPALATPNNTWRCPYCEAVIPMKARKCEECGAWRPRTYDDQRVIRRVSYSRVSHLEIGGM